MARITVKVHPRARRSAVDRPAGRCLEAGFAAPPVDGKANEECMRFLAGLAGVPRVARAHRDGRQAAPRSWRLEGVDQEDWNSLHRADR